MATRLCKSRNSLSNINKEISSIGIENSSNFDVLQKKKINPTENKIFNFQRINIPKSRFLELMKKTHKL